MNAAERRPPWFDPATPPREDCVLKAMLDTRAARHPELTNLHDLRTRTSGAHDFVQFHVDLPGSMTVAEAHDVIERVEADLCGEFPRMELLIHIDPQGHIDEPGNPLVEADEFGKLEKDAK